MCFAAKMKASLALAIIASSLVSYHFLAHDASIWLIPILLSLAGTSVVEAAFAAAMLVFPLTAVFITEGIHSHAYLGAIPLLGLFTAKVLHAREIENTSILVTTTSSSESIAASRIIVDRRKDSGGEL